MQENKSEMVTYISTGAVLGALLGFVLGVTFWTHSIDITYIVVLTLFVLVCSTIGGWIGQISWSLGEREEQERRKH